MLYFNKNLSLLRRQKSMTLSQISIELEFSPSQWSNYEQGISFPKFMDLIKISEYFKISESELIHEDLTINQPKQELNKKKLREIIELQAKLISIQEEKINNLKNKIQELNISGH